VAAALGLMAVVYLPQSWPPSPSPAPARDWAKCVATDPRACTTFDGVALGLYEGSARLDTPPCDACLDPPGTALAVMERLDPDHKALRAIDIFGPDLHVFCGDAPCAGPVVEIIVLTFADSATRPIVVFCPALIGATCFATDHHGPPYPNEPLATPTESQST
jgi:hypothetical protein